MRRFKGTASEIGEQRPWAERKIFDRIKRETEVEPDAQNEKRAKINGKFEAKVGADYFIPLPWPQDRPPDEQFLKWGFDRE